LQFQNRTGKSACATKIPPGDIPLENRQAIFKDLKTRGIGVSMKIKKENHSKTSRTGFQPVSF